MTDERSANGQHNECNESATSLFCVDASPWLLPDRIGEGRRRNGGAQATDRLIAG